MAENRNEENRGMPRDYAKPDSAKPESASKPGKRAYDERDRERASEADKLHQDNARGDRNPGNFQNSNKDSQR
jgi:hypothetical protein